MRWRSSSSVGFVGPVQVVEHEDYRRALGARASSPRPLEQAGPLGVGSVRGRASPADARARAGRGRAPRARRGDRAWAGGATNCSAPRRRLVGHAELLVAPPVQHHGAGSSARRPPPRPGGSCRCRARPRPARGRLARRPPPSTVGQHVALARPGRRRRPLRRAAGRTGTARDGLGVAAPAHDATGTGSGRPLSSSSPAGTNSWPPRPGRGGARGRRRGSGRRPRRRTGGRPPRRACRSSRRPRASRRRRDPDPHARAASGCAGVGVDRLLDGDRRADRVGRAGEHGQHAVAQALDHRAAVAGDGVGQQPVVGAAQLVGPLLTELARAARSTRRGR